MKIAALADVKAHLSAYVDECENEGPVIITRKRQGRGGTAGT
jgi:Antitoxin Phd_YefM, type II toxin-antitoxin system